jgi:very-short-patch-repair endonuclease
MTGPENVLWAELRKLDRHVRRQVPIGSYIADFAIHSAKLIIEVDGARHDLPENELHDALRDAWFVGQGYRTLRVRNNEILNDLNGVIALIKSTALHPARAKEKL